MSGVGYYTEALKSLWTTVTGRFMQGSPPEVDPQVHELLLSLGMNTSHLLQLYATFHSLAQDELAEDYEEETEKEVARLEAAGDLQGAAAAAERPMNVGVILVAREVKVDSMINLVSQRKKWVQKLLKQIMLWGECEETVDWDSFLWISLRFCSLSRIELAQTMFVIIQREMQSQTMHYITNEDLHNFYWSHYRLCPIKAFSTADIDFQRLPLTRYYATDFTELVQRFTQLLNPLLHLQQSFQAKLPDSAFWESLDRTASFPRRITFEFFSMDTNRVYLYGEPPFRESCDMLAPEALGPFAVNQDQWLLRVKSKVKRGPMSQMSVWGEQPPPELFDMLERQRQEREVKRKRTFFGGESKPVDLFDQGQDAPAATETPAAGADAATTQQQQAQQGQQPQQPGVANPKAAPPTAPTGTATSVNGVKDEIKATWASQRTAGAPGAAKPVMPGDPLDLSIMAAVLDEDERQPLNILPPRWMTNCTVAPAPKVRGPDPPLPRTLGRAAAQDPGLTQRAMEETLPSGWASAVDPASGNTYYFNRTQNVTQWERPAQ